MPTTIERNPYYTSFPYGWYGIVWADALKVGEVVPLHLFDRELVLWRDAKGAAHLMDAHCPHLGAHLGHGGRVAGCELVCPFHGWHWDAAGRNVAVPYASKPHPRARVNTWPTLERNGLVMAWYHPQGEPPSFEIPELPEYSSDEYGAYQKSEWKIATPWQETAENGPDFIHVRYVHGTPVPPVQEAYECEGHIVRMRSSITYASPKGDTPGRIDTESHGPGFSVARFQGIIDLCMVDWCVPIDFEHIVNHKGYMISRALGEKKMTTVGAAFVKELRRQMDEDIEIFEHKIWQPKPALLPEDGPIAAFRNWAKQFTVPADRAD